MKNNLPPVHPGLYIKEALPELGMNQADVAKVFGCSKQFISDIVNGRRGISLEMCFKLAEVLGSTPEFWSRVQNDYDIKVARKDRNILKAAQKAKTSLESFYRAKGINGETHVGY